MNKMKILKIVLAVFLVFTLSVGCQQANSTNNLTGVPVVSNLVFASSISNLQNGIFVTTLTIGTQYYCGFSISDSEMDVVKAVVKQTQTSGGTRIIGPNEISLPEQPDTICSYYAPITPDYTGTWNVDLYVVDLKQQKSNTVTCTINTISY